MKEKIEQLFYKLISYPATLLAIVLLSACQTTLPVVMKAPDCTVQLSKAILEENCKDSIKLLPGTTYGELLHDDKELRMSLASCSAKLQAAQASLKACQQVISDYNNKLEGLNK